MWVLAEASSETWEIGLGGPFTIETLSIRSLLREP